MKFAVITFAQSTDTDKGTAAGPEALLRAGLADWLREDHEVSGPFHAGLSQAQESAYGSWNKVGLANAQLARLALDAAASFSADLREQLLGCKNRRRRPHCGPA